MTHPLVALSKRSEYRNVPELPNQATYDHVAGVWMLGGDVLVRTYEFMASRVSKKADQETGEDQKGE